MSPKDVVGILLAAALLAAAVLVPNWPRWGDALKRANENFGPEWDCQVVAGAGEPICFKKPTAPGTQAPLQFRTEPDASGVASRPAK